MKLTKDYIIEGCFLRKGTTIDIEESVADESLVDTTVDTEISNVTEEDKVTDTKTLENEIKE